MYTSITLIQQKIGRSLTADEASFATTVAIPAITEWISNYLGINYDDANGTFVSYGHGGSAAVFIGAMASLTKVEYVDAEDNADLVGPLDYYQDGNWLFTRSGKPFNVGRRNIKVTGTLADVPALVQLAATMMAVKPLVIKGEKDATSEKIGDYQISYMNTTSSGVSGLADDGVLALLNQYKPMRLA